MGARVLVGFATGATEQTHSEDIRMQQYNLPVDDDNTDPSAPDAIVTPAALMRRAVMRCPYCHGSCRGYATLKAHSKRVYPRRQITLELAPASTG